MSSNHDTTEKKFEDEHFSLNSKGYIEFNSNLIIDSRYKLQQEIILDEELGTTAKGRYGSVFRVKDLKDGQIKALKINRIPPEEEDAKRQAAKEELKKQQTQSDNNTNLNHIHNNIINSNNNNNNNINNNNNHNHNPNNNNNNTNNNPTKTTMKRQHAIMINPHQNHEIKNNNNNNNNGYHRTPHKQTPRKQPPDRQAPNRQLQAPHKPKPVPNTNRQPRRYGRRRVKTVQERYKSSCKREIGVLKRVTRKNQNEAIPCLVLYDYGEYLGHTYMIFPVYDLPLQQHLINVQKYQESVSKFSNNPPNTAPNNALVHPDDLWAFEEQLISALAYIHNICNVMHLDFKPKNIMINRYGYDIIKYAKNLHLIKLQHAAITLIDFSVSAKAPKKANLDDVRYTGNFGTRRYRPPEMIYGGKWNRSVDTYGTACIILESIKLYPVIDTTYYKKKKILKYKKKLKKLQRNNNNINGKIKLHSNYKQLDISEVLYLIIQQVGFPSYEYWMNIDAREKALFPQYPLIENISRKGKRSKLFDNDGIDLLKLKKKQLVMSEMCDGVDRVVDGDKVESDGDGDEEESESEEDLMSWNLFSDKLKAHKGTAWNLFKQYGSNLIQTCRLDKMEESLKQMVVWDPRNRITPEQVLKIYFPKHKNNIPDVHEEEYDVNDVCDDD